MNKLNQYVVWTALVTPFNKDRTIDYQSFEKLIYKQQEAGNALLVVGSTGEGLALTFNEKKEIVKFVSDLNLNVPVMVGVGGFNLEQQLDWIEYCNGLSVDAYLLVTPLYAKPGIKGQVKWFAALLDKATKPCMLYNIPSRTGVVLYPEVVKSLEKHSNLWSLKEAGGSVEKFKQYREVIPGLSIFSGEDALMPELVKEGVVGLISASANVWPAGIKSYVERCLRNEIDGSVLSSKEPIESLFNLASNPVPVKVLLHHKGWIKEPVLRAPLTHEDLIDMERLIRADKQFGEE
jgi:4-hydroxy-tetrahydrodipicolinate synthase